MISVRKDLFHVPGIGLDLDREVDLIDGFTFVSYTNYENLLNDKNSYVEIGESLRNVMCKTAQDPDSIEIISSVNCSEEQKFTVTGFRELFAAADLVSIDRQLVMGRLKGHPLWPGVILRKPTSGDIVVRYLGEATFSLLDETEIRNFKFGFPTRYGRFSRKKRLQFLFAFSEAHVIVRLKSGKSLWSCGSGRRGQRKRKWIQHGAPKPNGRNYRRCIDVADLFLRLDVDEDQITDNFRKFEQTMNNSGDKCRNCNAPRKSRRKKVFCCRKTKKKEVALPATYPLPPTEKPHVPFLASSESKPSKVFELRKLSDLYKNSLYSRDSATLPLKKRYTSSFRPPDSSFFSQLQKSTNKSLPNSKSVIPVKNQPTIQTFFPSVNGRIRPIFPMKMEASGSTKAQHIDEESKVSSGFLANELISKEKIELPPHLADPSLILKAVNLVPKVDHNGNKIKEATGKKRLLRSSLKSIKVPDLNIYPKRTMTRTVAKSETSSFVGGRFTPSDLAILYEEFSKNSNPSFTEMKSIANHLHVRNPFRVRNWFTAQRAHAKQESKYLQDLQKKSSEKEEARTHARYSFRSFSNIKGYVIVTGESSDSDEADESFEEEDTKLPTALQVIAMDHCYCNLIWSCTN